MSSPAPSAVVPASSPRKLPEAVESSLKWEVALIPWTWGIDRGEDGHIALVADGWEPIQIVDNGEMLLVVRRRV